MSVSTQCISCVHYEGALRCEAFPDGIPEEIVTGEFDHRRAFPGDRGIRWEADPKYPAGLIDPEGGA